MSVCPFCKKEIPNSNDLLSIKTKEGKFSIACKMCISNRHLTPVVDKKAQTKKSSQTSIEKTITKKVEEEAFKKINSALDVISEKNAFIDNKQTYKREHERHDVNLEMQFSFLRDSKMYRGTVLDVSQGGIKFETDIRVKNDQNLKAIVFTPDTKSKEKKMDKIENFLDVRRVTPLENGLFQVGARFLKKISVDDKDRRKHVRRKASFPFFYKRDQSELINRGDVLDISPGGMRVSVHEEFDVDETVEINIRTSPPAFVFADLRGYYQVIRVFNKTTNTYQVGGRFSKLIVTPLDKE